MTAMSAKLQQKSPEITAQNNSQVGSSPGQAISGTPLSALSLVEGLGLR